MNSFEDVQADIDKIAARLNGSPELARAALINPILALFELGYELDLDAKLELEDRARFSKKQIVERKRLRKELFAAAKRPFDPGSSKDLEEVLYDELKLDTLVGERPDTSGPRPVIRKVPEGIKTGKILRQNASQSMAQGKDYQTKRKRIALPKPGVVEQSAVPDTLNLLKDAHQIVGPLLAYRQIDAATPRFAPEPIYHSVRKGERKLANIVPRAVVTGNN